MGADEVMNDMINKPSPSFWEKPGGDPKKENPWGNQNKEPGPPDIDQLFKQFSQKLRKLLGGGSQKSFSGGSQDFLNIGKIAFLLFIALYVISGIYIVDPAERAVVTRFGQYARTENPGPHWLPTFVEEKEIVNVEQVATTDHNGLMLTKDGNIVSVGVAVQYRIGTDEGDVRAYLFNVVNPEESLNKSTESALRQVVGQSTMDEVLTAKRFEIAQAIKEQTIMTLADYHTGISVLDVVMQFAKAPDEVRAAFDEVIKASADEERLVNQASGYENEVIPKAKGTAERLKREAEGYKEEKVLVAEGNVARFNLILPSYLKAPKVMQTRMYLDTMEQVFGKVSKIVVDAGQGNNVIYLPFDRFVPKLEAVDTKTDTNVPPELVSQLPSHVQQEKN